MFLMKLDLFIKFHKVKLKNSLLDDSNKTYFSEWLRGFILIFLKLNVGKHVSSK